MNRINLNPQIWGPKGWFFLESCIIGYPTNPTEHDKTIFKNILNNIGFILPCNKCRNNYINHLHEYPLNNKILSNKDLLLEWFVKIHNIASGKNNNLQSTLDYYTNIYSNDSNYNHIILISIIIIILLFGIIYYTHKLKK